MRVLVLHSNVPPDAPADELDTLYTAHAIDEALTPRGHSVTLAPFEPDPGATRVLLGMHNPDVVFNLVEAIWGQGELACLAPVILEKLNARFTGCPAAPMALAGDKPLAKRMLRLAGLPTPDWDEPPFDGLDRARRYIVKSATEDASLGLDDEAVLAGRKAALARAQLCRQKFGGRWFAEAYIHGREFNVSVMEENGQPRVLPIPEMEFHNWPKDRVRVVGHDAKWAEDSHESLNTIRKFGLQDSEPRLNAELQRLAAESWKLFGLRGFARVDFRVSEEGEPFILEINPNPCLEPGAGFAAASAQAGMNYADAVEKIIAAALSR